MKFSPVLSLLAAAGAALAQSFTATVTFDQTFDNPDGSLDTVACSNGPNGLAHKVNVNFSGISVNNVSMRLIQSIREILTLEALPVR